MNKKGKVGAGNTDSKTNVNQNSATTNCTTFEESPQYQCSFCSSAVISNLCLVNGTISCFRCCVLALEFAESWNKELKHSGFFLHFADSSSLDSWEEM